MAAAAAPAGPALEDVAAQRCAAAGVPDVDLDGYDHLSADQFAALFPRTVREKHAWLNRGDRTPVSAGGKTRCHPLACNFAERYVWFTERLLVTGRVSRESMLSSFPLHLRTKHAPWLDSRVPEMCRIWDLGRRDPSNRVLINAATALMREYEAAQAERTQGAVANRAATRHPWAANTDVLAALSALAAAAPADDIEALSAALRSKLALFDDAAYIAAFTHMPAARRPGLAQTLLRATRPG